MPHLCAFTFQWDKFFNNFEMMLVTKIFLQLSGSWVDSPFPLCMSAVLPIFIVSGTIPCLYKQLFVVVRMFAVMLPPFFRYWIANPSWSKDVPFFMCKWLWTLLPQRCFKRLTGGYSYLPYGGNIQCGFNSKCYHASQHVAHFIRNSASPTLHLIGRLILGVHCLSPESYHSFEYRDCILLWGYR